MQKRHLINEADAPSSCMIYFRIDPKVGSQGIEGLGQWRNGPVGASPFYGSVYSSTVFPGLLFMTTSPSQFSRLISGGTFVTMENNTGLIFVVTAYSSPLGAGKFLRCRSFVSRCPHQRAIHSAALPISSSGPNRPDRLSLSRNSLTSSRTACRGAAAEAAGK